MTKKHKMTAILLFLTPLLFFSGCDFITKMTKHEIVVEDNAYLRGSTSGAGFVNLILRKDAFWYSIKGNTAAADVDFEPVRITILGTFDVI